MTTVRWMVFTGSDSSHLFDCQGGLKVRLSDAQEIYDKIDTSQYATKCKVIKRLEFKAMFEPASKVTIHTKNF